MKGVVILGSTGSIGRSALAVLARQSERFRLVGLSAHSSADLLAEQVTAHRPQVAILSNGARPTTQPGGARWAFGHEAMLELVQRPDVDIVINAIVGAAGLRATLAALDAGKRLALANKESLVAGGPLVLEALRRGGGELVPVDSEHSAILQCLRGGTAAEVRRIILTASGGPFRGADADRLEAVTPAQALKHPTWSMGAKITIDSATLANKALEVIEAHFLFGLPYERIDVIVHPQSIIHSMVEFVDGSVVSQMGFPSMELPILYAMTHPERLHDPAHTFDPVRAGTLTFEPIDAERFRAFTLGVEAGRAGGVAPAVYNAANEVAVAGFLAGNLPFPAIASVIEAALDDHVPMPADSLETVLEADRRAREAARAAIEVQC